MASVLIDSYGSKNYNAQGEVYSVYPARGLAFTTPTTAYTLDSVSFYIRRYGTLSGNCYAKLYAATGTIGTDAVPTGSALATSAAVSASAIYSPIMNIDYITLENNTYV